MSFTIIIDTTGLAASEFMVDGVIVARSAQLPLQVSLEPGIHRLEQSDPARAGFLFTVLADGTVNYDPAADVGANPPGFLQGRLTNRLRVLGFAVTLDASKLSDPKVLLYGLSEFFPSNTPRSFNLLPAKYYLGQLASIGASTPFTVTADGKIDYDSAADAGTSPTGYLRGKGTSTLAFLGHPITLDASKLSDPEVSLYGLSDFFPSNTPRSFNLLPAKYYLGQPADIGASTPFTVTADGKIDYDSAADADSSPSGYLRGRGTSTIVFSGHAILIDATAISSTSFAVIGITKALDSRTPQVVHLLPAGYAVQAPVLSGPQALFRVRVDGTVDYDEKPDDRLRTGGRATTTLHLFDPDTPLQPWSAPAHATLLPDVWVALAMRGEFPAAIAVSEPVIRSLAVGLDPSAAPTVVPTEGMPAVSPALRWMTEFGSDASDVGSALNVGMGLRLPLNNELVAGVDRLLVVGLRAGDDAQRSLEGLTTLVESQRYTSGFALVGQGAPTNNTEDEDAHSVPIDADTAFRLASGPPLLPPGAMPSPEQRLDGHWLAWGLGADPATFARVEHANGTAIQAARSTLAAWTPLADSPLLWRMGLGRAAGGGTMQDASAIGSLPLLRIGSQPYAILAAAAGRGGDAAHDDGEGNAHLRALDEEVRCRAARALAFRSGSTIENLLTQSGCGDQYLYKSFADPAAPTSTTVAAADLFSDTSDSPWHPWPGSTDASTARDALDALARRPDVWVCARATQQLASLRTSTPSGLRIGAWGYVENLRPSVPVATALTDVGMAAPVREAAGSQGFIQAPSLAHAATAAVLRGSYDPGAPDSPAAVDLSSQRVRRARWLLGGIRKGQSLAQLLGYRIERRLQDAGPLAAYISKFRTLAATGGDEAVSLATAALEKAQSLLETRQRQDGLWITAETNVRSADAEVAAKLAAVDQFNDIIRADDALESDIDKATQAVQAAAAAVDDLLARQPRSVSKVTNRNIDTDIPDKDVVQQWRADLQTARNAVVTASAKRDALLQQREAIAAKAANARFQVAADGPATQALASAGAVRKAAIAARDRLTAPDQSPPTARDLQELVSSARATLTEAMQASWAQAQSSSTASRVIDGLALYRRWQRAYRDTPATPDWSAQTIPFGDPAFPEFPGPASTGAALQDYEDLLAQLTILAEEVDAVGDLAVAESVFQLVQGNAARSGATLDMLAGSAAPPDEFDVVRTPRSAAAVSHRVLTMLPADPPLGTRGWAANAHCVRARIEPALEACAAALLPPASNIVCACEMAAANGQPLGSTSVRASELQLSALDFVALAAASVEFANGSFENELANRLMQVVSQRPTTPAGAQVRLLPDETTAFSATDIGLADIVEVAAAIHHLTSGGRGGDGIDLGQPAAFAVTAVADLAARIADALAQTRRVQGDLAQAVRAANAAPTEQALTELEAQVLLAASWRIPAAATAVGAAGDTALADRIAASIAQAKAVGEELARRIAACEELPPVEGPAASKAFDLAQQKARLLLGPDVTLLPRIAASGISPWLQTTEHSAALQAGYPDAAAGWLQQVAYVREGTARLQAVLTYAQIVGAAPGQLLVGQLPWSEGDLWAALPTPTNATPGNRTATVVHCPVGKPGTGEVKLLFHDAWTELVPSAAETTAIAFHYPTPNAAPPNLALLAVSDSGQPWNIQSLKETVLGVVELAKARAAPSDGRVERLWFDDEIPAGATLVRPARPSPAWSWTDRDPAPPSGRRAHVEPPGPGWHGHWFQGASATAALSVGPDDSLFAYVYVPALQRPAALQVRWMCGKDSMHAAVWGKPDGISHHAGPVPPAGQWTRLDVRALDVGLGAQASVLVDGMQFNVQDGGAVWGRTGLLAPATAVRSVASQRNDRAWMYDRLPAGARTLTVNEARWRWTARDPAPYCALGESRASHRSAPAVGTHGHGFTAAAQPVLPGVGDGWFAYVYLDPQAPPRYILLQWFVGDDGEHRAYWGPAAPPADWNGADLGTPALQRVGDLPRIGRWVRLDLSCADVGIAGKTVDGMAFLVHDGGATWGPHGVSVGAITDELVIA